MDRFCSACGAPRVQSQVQQVASQAVQQLGAAAKGLNSAPWLPIALVGLSVLGGLIVAAQGWLGLVEGVRFLLVAGVPLILIAVVDLPSLSIEHRLAFSVGVGAISASRGATWLWDFLFDRWSIWLVTGVFALAGVLMIVTAVPQLPPSMTLWSPSSSRYLLAPGVTMAIPLIWMGASDSPFLWFRLTVAELLRGVLLAAIAVIASLLVRHLRQGLALAVAFVGLADVLKLVHVGQVPELTWPVIRGLIVVGMCAALILLPDSLAKAPAATPQPAFTATRDPEYQSRSTSPGTSSPRRSALELSGQIPPSVDPAAAGPDPGAAESLDRDVRSEVPPPPPGNIDAPPPSGPRRD